jgi:release factor glutamine methyltransferase
MPNLEAPPGDAPKNAVTIGSALRLAATALTSAGIDGAGNDARRLLAATLGLSAVEVLMRPQQELGPEQQRAFGGYIGRRCAREPVSRILGEREFYGRVFAISPATLDPRPESETLITAALELADKESWRNRALRILDVGTGSGCLLLTLLGELPLSTGLGTDISEAALATARANALRLGLEDRVTWQTADGLDDVAEVFDLMVSNPPYIRTAEIAGLEPEVRDFDPRLALDGGSDGLATTRRLVAKLPSVIMGGWALLEVGYDQAEEVARLVETTTAGRLAELAFYRDVAGRRRCVAAKTRG